MISKASTCLSVLRFTSKDVWKRFPVAGQIQGDVVESKILRNKVNIGDYSISETQQYVS